MPLPAFRAFSLDDEGDGVGIESFRQFEARNMDILHAERTVAGFAVEMNMTIMMITLSFLLTHFVVQYPPSILEGMNGIMLQKERQRAEDA